jgi:hypothetical protein
MKTDIIKKRQRYESNTSTANAGGRKNSGKKSKGDTVPSSPGSQQEEMVVSPTLFQQPPPLYVSSGFNQSSFTTQQPTEYQPTFDTTTSTDPSTPVMDEMMANNYF